MPRDHRSVVHPGDYAHVTAEARHHTSRTTHTILTAVLGGIYTVDNRSEMIEGAKAKARQELSQSVENGAVRCPDCRGNKLIPLEEIEITFVAVRRA